MSESTSESTTSASSSDEQLAQLPVLVGKKKKKTLVPVADEYVNKQVVAQFMNGVVGNPCESAEIRENVFNLHGHLIPSIEALKQILRHSSEELSVEVKKLVGHYATLAKICEKLLEKAGRAEGVPEFQKDHQPQRVEPANGGNK